MSHEPRIQQLSDDFAQLGLRPFHTPLGVMLNEKDSHVSRCIRCETCDGFPCLVGAKSDAQVCAVDPALQYSNVTLKTGEYIELTEYLAPQGRPIPVDSRANDRWFQHIAIVVSDMDKAYQQLRAHKVRHASTGPQTIPASNKAAAGIRAFYFKDPDGHNVEIIYFPLDKGDPRWQNSNGKLFLGIDHTAIVVGNTQASLKFYRDLLGLKLAGESMNHGTEQEHLNNVAGARLRISGLRAESGPGIEFLDYVTPRSGRPAPADTQANDLWHWQTTLSTTSAATAAQNIRAARGRVVSPGIAEISDKGLGFVKGFLARDPDGHGLQLIER